MPAAKTKTKGAPSPLRAIGAWKRSKKLKLLDRPSPRKELFALPLREGSANEASLYLDEARGFLAIGGWRGLEIIGLATGQRSAVALGGDVVRVIGCVGDTLFVRAARGLFASVDLKAAKVVATQPVEGVLSAALLDDGRLVVMTHVGTDYAGTREARVFDLRRPRPEVHTFVHPGMFAPRQVSSHQGRLWIVHEGADPETTLIDTTQLIGEKGRIAGTHRASDLAPIRGDGARRRGVRRLVRQRPRLLPTPPRRAGAARRARARGAPLGPSRDLARRVDGARLRQ